MGINTSYNQRSERFGWYFYDWANSAFPTTVITVFLGPYLTSVANNAAGTSGVLNVFGMSIAAGSFFPYIVSLSVILQVLVLPLVGAITDLTYAKKLLLGVTAYIGAIATMGLYFLEGSNYLYGGLLFIIANLAFGSSMVVYNSILNDIALPEERDDVSSRGWAFGYIGGGSLLALNLYFFANAEAYGISTGTAVRICLVSAGFWWAIFTLLPMFKIRPYPKSLRSLGNDSGFLLTGFRQFFRTVAKLRKYPQTLLFVVAYLIYNDGVQAVIALSAQFGQEELGLDISFLTTVILLVQFVAFGGALFFNFLARKVGTKNALIISLLIWIASVVFAFAFLYGETAFMALGLTIGFVLGGTQALSRSLFSNMIPKGEEAEYFSLYEIGDKGTSWMAPLIFGLVFQFSSSYRLAILSLIFFFVVGLIVLLKVNVSKAFEDLKNS